MHWHLPLFCTFSQINCGAGRYNVMKCFKVVFFSFLLVAVGVISPFTSYAETLSQKQASKIAETFFNAAYGQYMAAPKFEWNGRQLTTDRLFAPFYVYNHPKGGFVIISADTKAYPILGYSRTSKFDKDKLTDAEHALLKKYAHEIELIRYDSRSPEHAIEAWRNMPLYINKVLNNPYDTPEYSRLSDEERDGIEAIDRRNNSVMMPSAVEFEIYNPDNFRDYTLDDVLAPVEEEIPFKFYEDFLALIKDEEKARLASLDEILSPAEPVIINIGGAHYSIRFPENMRMAVIYSMQGTKMQERYFKDTDTVYLDLSALPMGYYAVMALGEDGHIYGIKLRR